MFSHKIGFLPFGILILISFYLALIYMFSLSLALDTLFITLTPSQIGQYRTLVVVGATRAAVAGTTRAAVVETTGIIIWILE